MCEGELIYKKGKNRVFYRDGKLLLFVGSNDVPVAQHAPYGGLDRDELRGVAIDFCFKAMAAYYGNGKEVVNA